MPRNNFLRIALIGAGDIEFHYFDLLKIPEKEFHEQTRWLAKALKEAEAELVVLPDRGVSFEVAKLYKESGGRRVYATIPLSDKDFGIEHLRKYIDMKTAAGEKIIDEIINTQNWYKQDLTHCIFGDVVLMLGNSLGSMGEMVYGYYLYKIFAGEKPEVKARKKRIHPEARAGETIPFSLIIYKPFIKEKLSYELEAYIKRLRADIYYANSPDEVKEIIKTLGSGMK